MRKGQLALRAGAASGVLVPVADNRITVVLNEIKIIGDDLLDRLAEAAKVACFQARNSLASTAVRFFISSSAGS